MRFRRSCATGSRPWSRRPPALPGAAPRALTCAAGSAHSLAAPGYPPSATTRAAPPRRQRCTPTGGMVPPAGSRGLSGSRHDGPVTEPSPGPGAAGDRRAELSGRLAAVRRRIESACHAAGRDSGEVTLIAVTKTYPVSDIRLLTELGVRDIGENRDQEAAPSQALGLPVTWHFVGQLQTNKVASVARYADLVHSVDRLRLVRALGMRARAVGRQITCLVQVSLDGDPRRGGAVAGQALAVADAVACEAGLRLGGVMA